jgi:hypothetical protein
MNIRERFADSYIKADDLSSPITAVITDVDEVTIGDDDRVVLIFEDEKALPLNKTNALTLSDMFGDETDEWIGNTIELYRDKVMFQGKRVNAVRIREPRVKQPRKQLPNAKDADPAF